jgi:hypothetical protein
MKHYGETGREFYRLENRARVGNRLRQTLVAIVIGLAAGILVAEFVR